MELEAVDLKVSIKERLILSNESVRCRPGEITSLIGPSGCGKTTLLHCLGLLQPPLAGLVLVEGKDTSSWGGSRRRGFWRNHAAFVLQDYGILEEETVAFNVLLRKPPSKVAHKTDDATRLDDALQRTGLIDRRGELAAHLSGGEKQRLAIARALFRRADVVLVDEPTASLDEANRLNVIELLTGLARSGCTVVAATHDSQMMAASQVCHEVGPRSPDVTEHTVDNDRGDHVQVP